MANRVILADTSILIDYFRKSDKSRSKLITLYDEGYDFVISAITHYEIYAGTTPAQLSFWTSLLAKIMVLPFDKNVAQISVEISQSLKVKNKQIGIADLFIAATAVSNDLPLATLNKKHFERIESLTVID